MLFKGLNALVNRVLRVMPKQGWSTKSVRGPWEWPVLSNFTKESYSELVPLEQEGIRCEVILLRLVRGGNQMSRIGRAPNRIFPLVLMLQSIGKRYKTLKGPKGNLQQRSASWYATRIWAKVPYLWLDQVTIRESNRYPSHGLTRSLIANMIQGVTAGFTHVIWRLWGGRL